MRQIKFRAWTNTEMTTSDKYESMSEFWYDCKDCKIMQFTGLLDKNGKEIYEGDIVFDEDGEFSKTCKIEWHNENAQFVGVDIDGLGGFQMEEIDGEIIGNIYENPELLSNQTT